MPATCCARVYGPTGPRAVEGWQDFTPVFNWAGPSLHPQSLRLASAIFHISYFSRSLVDVKWLTPYKMC